VYRARIGSFARRAGTLAAVALALPLAAGGDLASAEPPPGFQETVAFSGLTYPTDIEFSPDGRVFIAEKSGLIKVYDGLGDSTPTVFENLRTEVHNYWDRGLLGMALDPEFPADPYVYVLYTRDAMPGGESPEWGEAGAPDDTCPTPPGPTEDGCVVTGRLTRLTASGNVATARTPLITDWCQQYPSHSTGDLAFGADGSLYVSAGDGASFNWVDYGHHGDPLNPCGDPPSGVGGHQNGPHAEGGALRSQDARTTSDPTGLDGSILRIDPGTGAGLPGNPYYGDSDANRARIAAIGQRNPFRITVRPGTNEVWSGDVGWGDWEEINWIAEPGGSAENFGWPCYEGSNTGNARQWSYDQANLNLCESLYEPGDGQVARPYYSYSHAARVMPGESCPSGGSSISGLAFYTGGPFPDAYDGALFFSDFTRGCIWAMLPTNGLPDPSKIRSFNPGAAGPVEVEVRPAGDLFYVDFGGTVRRITYSNANSTPDAVATANPSHGPAPLSVQLSAAGSSDPDGDPLSFAWDLDEDGQFDDASSATLSRLYEGAGAYTATVRVTDPDGESATDSVEIQVDNTPPRASITAPGPSFNWGVGEDIVYSGSATDPQQGSLPPSAFRWSVLINHCPGDSCHQHIIEQPQGVTEGTFTAPDHEYPASLVFRLTVTDAGGLTATDEVKIDPRTVEVTLSAVPEAIEGLELGLDGATAPSPFSSLVIEGSRHTVVAPARHTTGGETWFFDSWSNGGAATHDLVASEDLELTASYDPNAPPNVSAIAIPASGPAPLSVQLSATASDPEGTALSFAWDLDEDGEFDDSAGATASRTYTASGSYAPEVRVTDGDGKSTLAALLVAVTEGASLEVESLLAGSCGGLAATRTGTAGNDVIKGTSGPDVIASLGGRDEVSGSGGRDVICGGPGADLLMGGRGADRLFGQAGRDRLGGGKGFDACSGGRGFDRGFACETGRSAASG
jgi:glucose/arabinose dehydrogenase/PKD repeat protein